MGKVKFAKLLFDKTLYIISRTFVYVNSYCFFREVSPMSGIRMHSLKSIRQRFESGLENLDAIARNAKVRRSNQIVRSQQTYDALGRIDDTEV